ncbi:hypothetical protein VPNG_00055 [Cytospora leucostoma]|uniref:Uncharacterized protein n=1 Tax=Cytospora leucostoma TaxID=1230097 RepID=A0A423XN57_9PEZI|nr:hypothetical protein VPNG_00055 [Cytospora leucostoma]
MGGSTTKQSTALSSNWPNTSTRRRGPSPVRFLAVPVVLVALAAAIVRPPPLRLVPRAAAVTAVDEEEDLCIMASLSLSEFDVVICERPTEAKNLVLSRT